MIYCLGKIIIFKFKKCNNVSKGQILYQNEDIEIVSRNSKERIQQRKHYF